MRLILLDSVLVKVQDGLAAVDLPSRSFSLGATF